MRNFCRGSKADLFGSVLRAPARLRTHANICQRWQRFQARIDVAPARSVGLSGGRCALVVAFASLRLGLFAAGPSKQHKFEVVAGGLPLIWVGGTVGQVYGTQPVQPFSHAGPGRQGVSLNSLASEAGPGWWCLLVRWAAGGVARRRVSVVSW